MIAAFAFILALIVLIPVLAIVIDSDVGKALARRISSSESLPGAGARLDTLESEVDYLTKEVESLRDESRFLRSLVEGPEEPAGKLAPPGEAAGALGETAGPPNEAAGDPGEPTEEEPA